MRNSARREAVDTYLTQVSDNPVLKAENLEPLRRELLRTARDFYERFVQQEPDDPELQVELGRAHERLGLITSILESPTRGLEHYQKMQAIFDRLHRADPGNPAYQKELAGSYLPASRELPGRDLRSDGRGLVPPRREMLEALVRDHPEEPAYQHDLARSLRKLGNLYIFLANDLGKPKTCCLRPGRFTAVYPRPICAPERAV